MDELLQELNGIQNAANVRCDYLKTLALLRALKAGSVSLDDVTMTDDGWTVAENSPAAEPDQPATEPVAETSDESESDG